MHSLCAVGRGVCNCGQDGRIGAELSCHLNGTYLEIDGDDVGNKDHEEELVLEGGAGRDGCLVIVGVHIRDADDSARTEKAHATVQPRPRRVRNWWPTFLLILDRR